MAGGVSTPALAGAVASAGGVGSLGFAYSTPARIAADLTDATRLASGGVLNANFFVFVDLTPGSMNQAAWETAREAFELVARESALLQAAVRLPEPPWYPDLGEQLDPVWDLRPRWLSFHFGLPPDWVIRRAHDLGMSVAVTATCVAEARRVLAAGVDLIVAQGAEAGGHRGVFDPGAADAALATIDLVQQLRTQCDAPIIAAGGVMNGRDMAMMLEAGAAGVQMGTAFLCCPESGASAAHKRLCLEDGARGTEWTTAFSGRPARGIRNRFIEAMRERPALPFPLQNMMTGPLRAAAVAADDPECQSLWAGTGYAKARPVGAGEVVREVVAQGIGGVTNAI